jgi:hypothetical protein
MQKFNSKTGLILAKAKSVHESNLNYGGVFTEDYRQAIRDGFETRRAPDGIRISNMSFEVKIARKSIKRAVLYIKDGNGIMSPVHALVIHGFGYVPLKVIS